MTYGVTSEGFIIKRADVLKADLERDLRAEFGDDLDLTPSSPFGQLVAGLVPGRTELWALGQALYNAGSPSGARGVHAEDLAAYSLLSRVLAAPSTVVGILRGTEGTVVAAGKQASVGQTGSLFALTDAVTITTATVLRVDVSIGNVSTETDYVITLGETTYTYTSTNSTTEEAILAGLSALVGDDYEVATIDLDGDGEAETLRVEVPDQETPVSVSGSTDLVIQPWSPATFQATQTGPIVAPPRSLTNIETPVSGWEAVDNLMSETIGRDTELDDALLVRMTASSSARASASAQAIWSALTNEVDGVSYASVTENDTAVTNSAGVPAYSVEAVVQGGADEDVARAIYLKKAGGIRSYGRNDRHTFVNDQGQEVTIHFTRPTTIYAHLRVTKTLYLEESYPIDGDTLLKSLLVAYGQTLGMGHDLIAKRFEGQAVLQVPGLEDCSLEVALTTNPGDTPTYVSATRWAVAATQLVDFTTTRVVVL
jgi:uncharacterized phage protein gp47/JayE